MKQESKPLDQVELFKKSGRGGARAGSGQPKKEETQVIRVPVGCLKAVTRIIELHKAGKLNGKMLSLRSEAPKAEGCNRDGARA